jgi:hypothetical protein
MAGPRTRHSASLQDDRRSRRVKAGSNRRCRPGSSPAAVFGDGGRQRSVAEEGQDREYSAMIFGSGCQAKLGEDAADVGLDSLGRHP